MGTFIGKTDAKHSGKVKSRVRCYWSAEHARNQSDVWIRVEAYRVHDGTAVRVRLRRKDNRQVLDSVDGAIQDGLFEKSYHLALDEKALDRSESVALVLEVSLDDYDVFEVSAPLHVARPSFSR